MVTTQTESFGDGLNELREILPLHFEELALNQDKVPLNPQWNTYFAKEDAGELFYCTLRLEGNLIGYYIGFISPGLHYATCLTCCTDIFFIRKEYRSGGYGRILFQFVEKELRRRGVNRWFTGSKSHVDASKFFEKLNFKKVEVYYSKWLED